MGLGPEFDEGYTAYYSGLKERHNPYETNNKMSPNYDKARSWQLGWTEAWLDDK